MAKNEKAAGSVKIKLNCVYAGFVNNPGPGDVIEVDAAEATRLIDLGAAEAITEAPAEAQ